MLCGASEFRLGAAAPSTCILNCKTNVPAGGHHDFCGLWVSYDLPEALQLQCTWTQLLLFLHCHIGSPLSYWSCATGEAHNCKSTVLCILLLIFLVQQIAHIKWAIGLGPNRVISQRSSVLRKS